ncbi:MAG TPA: Lrp/AsnC family transcriptional regulator [Candidatus Competibacteraceae bacterium]|nr:Lrp/AsnC family transcriptional regulator [Candidatus Competibacteraceae bacterium]
MQKKIAVELDGYDRRLLLALQEDARQSHVALAEKVNLSPTQCARRLQRLEQAGLVRGYAALLEPEALGLAVLAFVTVNLDKQGERAMRAFHDAVRAMPQILECFSVTGEGDYLLRVVMPDLRSLSRFLMEELMRVPGVREIRSTVVLEEIKSTTRLPLP